ncbi:MAG: hypothetical protein ABJA18_03815 [bacterium]
MKKTKKRNNLTLVRAQVKALLTSSPAFQSLPPDQRKQIAHDMVKVAKYLVAQESHSADKTIADVDFPEFVSNLLNGVFDAIVDASIKQMEAYAKLVAGVAKSLDEFISSTTSDNEARDYLVYRLPHFFGSSSKPKRLRVRLASSRQKLLATMMLMGINRIVVTDGRISAKKS